jgi:O-antigen/teichoic acid export membrane protein
MVVPVALVGQAISQVFLSRAARASEGGSGAHLASGVLRRLWLIALPLAVLVGVAAPEFFSFVFGGAWHQAGVYAQWQAPWLLFSLVASPLSPLTVVLDKQPQEAVFQAVLLFGGVGALLIGGVMGTPSFAIALYSAISALCWAGYLVWIMRISGNPISVLVGWMTREAVYVCLLAAPLFAAKAFASGPGRSLIVLLAAGLSAGLMVIHLGMAFRREGAGTGQPRTPWLG